MKYSFFDGFIVYSCSAGSTEELILFLKNYYTDVMFPDLVFFW